MAERGEIVALQNVQHLHEMHAARGRRRHGDDIVAAIGGAHRLALAHLIAGEILARHVSGVDGARVNLYLMQLFENAGLKNQEIPRQGHPGAYGHPPLSLNLRYLLTTYSAMETQPDADLRILSQHRKRKNH